jgi:hypothetical protein
MGRPPLGERAMTPAEKMRRYRARKFGNRPPITKAALAGVAEMLAARIRELLQQLTQAHKRIAGLERRGAGEGQLTRSHREERSRPVEFTEVGKLRAEIGRLKSDNFKLKAALQEEPDAAKLRKKVVDLQVEKAGIRQELRRVAKERDKYQAHVQPKYSEARKLLTRENHNAIINALHVDRLKQCSPDELKTAHRLITALRPLFDES